MFDKGQKVVCVNERFPAVVMQLYTELPKEGSTYTVRDVCPGDGWDKTPGKIRVLVEELTNPTNSKGEERGFDHVRFAPLQEAPPEEEVEEEPVEADLEKALVPVHHLLNGDHL